MALEVEIRKRIGGFVLHSEFTADRGVFALLGASGSGKSLTLKCIAGIEKPDEGRIVLDGHVLFDSSKKINLPPQKRRVGYMFQDYALFPNMTVRKNVMAGMGRNPDSAAADEILRRFRISDLENRIPSELSGGQKQRVAMARIAAQKPDAILLDEPFAALDSHLKWMLEGEMKQLLESMGKPAVFVSHSRDEVYHMSSSVCCMEQGKTGETLELHEFFRNPGTRAAALLSGCKNITAVRVLDDSHIEAVDYGLVFHIGREIPKDVKYAGIRAHDISDVPCSDWDNEFRPSSAVVQEDPFEWTVFLKNPGGSVPIQWKTPKKDGKRPEVSGPFYLSSRNIMLLRE